MPMSAALAIEKLQSLVAEASDEPAIREDGPRHQKWRASVDAVLANSLVAKPQTLERFRGVNYHIGVWTGAPGEAEQDRRYFAGQVDEAVAIVEAAIFELEMLAESESSSRVAPNQVGAAGSSDSGTIFVVHGHDESAKYQVVRVLDKATDRDAVILHEQANNGATVLEKFEHHAGTAAFAVIILTPDDVGGTAPSKGAEPDLVARGRQNVIFEMGFFFGLLGRGRVAVLYESGVELPSDLNGLVYIELDPGGAWKIALAKELTAAGVAVNHSRIP